MNPPDPAAGCPPAAFRTPTSGPPWLAWSVGGTALAAIDIFPWLWNDTFRRWEAAGQLMLFGIPFDEAPYPLRIDMYLHIIIASLGTLWLSWLLGRWHRHWWAVLAGALVTLADEGLQGLDPERTFGLDDLASSWCGVLLAAGILVLYRRKPPVKIVDS